MKDQTCEDATINKTLDLSDLDKKAYRGIVIDIERLISDLDSRGLKYTTYQAEFNTGWGIDNIWLKRKLWEMSHMIKNSGVGKGQRVLDCGGASSVFSFYLAFKGCLVETVDIDWRGQRIVENANEVARKTSWNMHNLNGDMSQLPYKKETFDRVFSICVLEHLHDDVQLGAVKEMARTLKHGGVLGLTFDYGPSAPDNRYADVEDINRRIVKPSGLQVMGNLEYRENTWFPEQYGASWGALFLKNATSTANHTRPPLLHCSKPQGRSRVMSFLSNMGLRKGNIVSRFNRFLFLSLHFDFGRILGALKTAFRKSR